MRRDHGLCQVCLARGLLRYAVEVDHIVPLSKGGADTDGNKLSLCRACHDYKTRQDKGYRVSPACNRDGMPDPGHPWNMTRGSGVNLCVLNTGSRT